MNVNVFMHCVCSMYACRDGMYVRKYVFTYVCMYVHTYRMKFHIHKPFLCVMHTTELWNMWILRMVR